MDPSSTKTKRSFFIFIGFCAGVGIITLMLGIFNPVHARQIVFMDVDNLLLPKGANPSDQILALAAADPVADATLAYSRGDMRYVGVFAHAPVVPPWGRRADGALMIAFTSDVQSSPEAEKLSWLAYHYAKNYNTALQKLIIEK